MATFNYQAEDERGNVVSGVIEATDEHAARLAIQNQGMHPTRVKGQTMALEPMSSVSPAPSYGTTAVATLPASEVSTLPVSSDVPALAPDTAHPMFTPVGQQTKIEAAPFLVGVRLTDLAVMYRQLGTLLGAGVPMVQSLMALAEQTRQPRLKEILNEMVQSVSNGNPLSRTMERYPAVFSQLQIEMIRAAEMSGMMEQMCSRIADYLERDIAIKRKINQETFYPKIVLFVAFCVLMLLAFLKSGAEGPLGMLRFAGITVVIGFAIFWLVRFSNQFPSIGAVLDYIKMLIPGVGNVARRYATARFTRALGALYAGGVLLPTAVAIAARACGNRAIGQTMVNNVPRLMEGQGLSGMLAASGLLSPIAVQMARTGEQTGSLDTMMDKVADYLESEADQKSHQYAIIFGVVVLMVAAMVVLYIAISFYTGRMQEAFSATG